MSQDGTIELKVKSKVTASGDLADATLDLFKQIVLTLKNGAGLNQANNHFSDRRTVAGEANENLDLAGALSNGIGATTFTKVKALLFIAHASNPNALTISRPASNGVPFLAAAEDAVSLAPGGVFLLVDPTAAGIVVTAGTGDLINVANPGVTGSCSYDVIVIGVTA